MFSKRLWLFALTLLCSSPVSAVIISEVMYHPQTDETHGEYVEIYNETVARMDLGRWQFTEGIHYTFPEGYVLQPRSYLVIARDPATLMTSYGITNVVGPYTGALNNASDHIILRDPSGGIMAEVDYEDGGKWPVAADGAGHSLAKYNMRGDPMDPDNWRASPRPRGTPGADNGFGAMPATVPVVINEVRFYTSATQYIEIYNKNNAPFNIGRFYLSNDPDNLKLFQISTGTMIGARSRLAFLQSQLGFTMNTAADRILLTSPTGNIVIDARAVERGPLNWTEGRWPDGASEWYYMNPTTGTANSVALNTSVVINEIMYNPPTNDVRDQYVELFNSGATTVSLAGWQFTRGINYLFTTNTVIGPGRYVVLAKDRNRMISRYGLSPSMVLGNTSGTLGHAGEKIRLRDANMNPADEVTYSDGGHWPQWTDGYGSSLELIDPRQDNSNYQAWAASDERSKMQWRQYWWSGSFPVTANTDITKQELQLNLMGPGVMLLDDVKISQGATDYLNSTFESGLGSWTVMGNHIQSYVTTEDAHGGSRSLKVIATGRGDTGINHIEGDATTLMPLGTLNLSVTFWAKWQWGNRVISLRMLGYGTSGDSTAGNYMPKTLPIEIPLVTGTPGAQNSVYRANLGPVFREVIHSPVIPNAATQVQITARAYDPDGVASVTLFYKANSDGSYLSTPMFDDGLHGDGAAGDGLYGGQIPARAAGQTVAFYLQGADGLAAVNTWPTDTTKPPLYRVANAPLSSTFPTYRIIMTATDENTLYNVQPKLSNEEQNCTFIFDEKEVYSNCWVRFIGSPWHRAGGGYTGLKVSFNSDQRLHGIKDQARVDDNGSATVNRDDIHDRLSYNLQRWMRLPSVQQEWAYVVLDGRENRVLEDCIAPSSGLYAEIAYPGDADGYCFEVDDRFWYLTDGTFSSGRNQTDARFDWWGADKDIYRQNFEPRNHDNEDNYTSIVVMLDVLNPPGSQNPNEIARVINVEEWFRLFAVRACLSDWDFIAFNRGKNCFLYWPMERGKWDLLGWDSELTFSQTQMSIWSTFAAILAFQQHGRHQHLYYSYIKELLDKYFTRANMDPWIDHYGALLGISGTDLNNDKTFISARRTYLLGIMPVGVCDITTNGGNPFSVTTPTVTLQGTAPVEVRWIRVGGIDYYPDWTGAIQWTVKLPLHMGVNVLTLEFLNYDKVLVGTDSITVTVVVPITGSIVINSGAAYTTTTTALLTLYATATVPIADMHLSNDNAIWTGWESYATSRTWTLLPGDGTKTVYLQVRDTSGGLSTVFTDTIVIDTAPPTGNVLINFGAVYTNLTVVTLSLFGSDAGSGVVQMRLSNDNLTWNPWETFAIVKAWSLSSGDGMKAVYAQYRDATGKTSDISSDSITLDATPPLGSVQINGGTSYTNQLSVTLTVSATDGGSGVSSMHFSNDNATWTAWEAYATTKPWTLLPGDGQKTVFVQFRDTAVNTSAIFNDTIGLDTAGPTGSILINGGTAKTNSSTVSLTVSASDSGSVVSQMRFSNDNSAWSNWQPYETGPRPWNLIPGDGLKTAYVQFRDQLGNSSTSYSDTILLDSRTGGRSWLLYE